MLHMIKRDFVNLEKLILVYPLQEEENEFYARTGLDPGVVQAERIVAVGPALRSLRGLSVVVEKAAATSASNEERELVPLVEYTDLQNPQQHAEGSSTAASSFASWSLLPEKVQRKVIEFSALPPDRLIHPLLATDTFPETRTIMPLLLTSKDTSRVTQDVVYRGAIFASCLRKDRAAMYTFFQKRTLQQAQMIERYNINGLDHWIDRRLSKFLKSHCPNARDMEHTFRHTMSVNPCWNVDWAS
ncbi:uncharacterized protein K489DRAFT_380031 [Dissoconium aciculare CBS 342.82]|uniref:Uncharacterized protein n=1 Tax=Dissoconium aciculare CBS 342.82 TaxID=1314786 RepID=A0A6J3M3Q1_9PEZI|nr:uncharacterized protein K489DRAFT_380031 [Dissoconium aciculare CBS 342.82]KAF1822656.1 hypothetical protein K489DRAFT_380031 [Dissoconium aciculare CBS 342.82]